MAAHQAPPSLGFSRQEHWSGLPFPSPMHESEKWKWSRSVVLTLSDPMDCSLPGSSIHGIFQARVLEWGAIVFSEFAVIDQSYVKNVFLSLAELWESSPRQTVFKIFKSSECDGLISSACFALLFQFLIHADLDFWSYPYIQGLCKQWACTWQNSASTVHVDSDVKGTPWNVKWDSPSPWFLVPVCTVFWPTPCFRFPCSWILTSVCFSSFSLFLVFLSLLSFCIYFWASDIFIWEQTNAKFYPISRY